MASPSSATVLFTDSFRFPPRVVLLVFAALIYGAAAVQPTMTLCSGHGQSPYFTSPPAVTSRELASFLDAVCAGAYGAAHRSHNMSSYVAGTNRTMYGVAECRPDVPVPDCAACLAAASARLIAGRTECAAAAVWYDVCFLRYSSDGDPVLFRDGDECTATVFNATSTLPPHVGGGAVVRRLLAAAAKRTMRSHMCRGGVGASTVAAGVGARIYGLTRCAAGVSCADCRRCLRGALAAAEREYNGNTGMQILQLSCTARQRWRSRTIERIWICVLSGSRTSGTDTTWRSDPIAFYSSRRKSSATATASTSASRRSSCRPTASCCHTARSNKSHAKQAWEDAEDTHNAGSFYHNRVGGCQRHPCTHHLVSSKTATST